MSTVAATSVIDLPLWAPLAISAFCGALVAGGGALFFSRLTSGRHESARGADPITGVADRRSLVERLDAQWCAAREGHGEFGLLVVDVDAFGDINQLYGRATGDRVLAEVAERIRLRVPCEDFVARVDADEFAVICHDVGPEGIEAVRCNLEAYVNFALSVPVMLSIGIATPSETDTASLDLLERGRVSLARRRADRPLRVVDDALSALLSPR